MIELADIIKWFSQLSPIGLYSMLFFISYIENIFPPSPSDILIIFIATLIGIGTIGLGESIIISTLGSITGFLTAFWLGRKYGRKWIDDKKFKFLDKSSFEKVENWFEKYNYGIIIANRFLAGTRAIISFFAGMSKLKIVPTTILCSISALIWNTILINIGKLLGDNWEYGVKLLSEYNMVVLSVLALVVVYFTTNYFIKKYKSKNV